LIAFRSVFSVLIASSTLMLTNCGGSSSPASYPNATIAISPQITSLAVNGTQTFTATVTNGPANPVITWSIYGATLGGSFSGGQFVASGITVTYTAPATPPVYSENTVGGSTNYHSSGSGTGDEGITSITAGAAGGTGTSSSASASFAVTGPVSTGIAPTTATVQLSKLQSFSGYCVGSTNNNLVWQVNGVAGGAAATGTIAPQVTGAAYFTAPAAMPMTGNTVTVTAGCQADPSKSASSTVTLTP